ncbi:cation-translocating P-type ATPase [Actinomadura macra]|uniref:cation-translocating P-type ATPase n=1 Tax=Actinomadura macra TaxID=46164 RepID=UPI00082EB04A|nr:cation-transporting P-type ATPase [Actinomadura macra]
MVTEAGPTPVQRGLTSDEAAARLHRNGRNILPTERSPSPLISLARQMVHFFALLLWGAAGLAYVGGMPQLAVAIAVVVVFNGVFAFAQEYRAERAGRRLRELLPARVTVRRDGRPTVIDTAELVIGDIVLLGPGDRISADLELLETHSLAVDESMLTGESVPARPEKSARVHAGTFVTEGEAEAVTVATGSATRLADIAALTRSAHRRPSPLALQLHRVVLAVAVIAVAVGASFFGAAVLLGLEPGKGFLLAVGVTVALVPEGLLPTVTLSLARAAQRMAGRHALVRRLEAVETLGSTTFICTDKTGTLTRNEMAVVEVWTPSGTVSVQGAGYSPEGHLTGAAEAVEAVRRLASTAHRCSTGRTRRTGGRWQAIGDPMEAALHVLALRAGSDLSEEPVRRRLTFDARRRRASALTSSGLHLTGAPDSVLPRCGPAPGAEASLAAMTGRGLRVLAVAVRRPEDLPDDLPDDPDDAERELTLLGLVGLEDPPRDDVAAAIASCRRAGIRLAMITGDHPTTARAIATEVGLAGPDALVVSGTELPRDETALGRLLDRDQVVVARVTPEDKLRIARALQARGHVVAMTGDGVNDGPALRQADIGVAMGASGTDVAREAADLVLLDDHFATIVAAVEEGRATFSNIRRFLTYHLTDNVAELVPFVAWAATGGKFPLALSVLQILALDIGTDILPALALGAEPAGPRTMEGRVSRTRLIDRGLLGRVFGVLGPAEAAVTMAAFATVLVAGGWSWGEDPSDALLFTASGTAFATIMLGQMAAAFSCRSESRWAGRLRWTGNPLLLWAVTADLVVMLAFMGVPPLAHLLGGGLPSPLGWLIALIVLPAVLLADATAKTIRARRAKG